MKLIILFLMLAAPCFGQETCALKTNEAPAIFALRLGMPPAEVQTILGRELKVKISKKSGTGVFFQNFIKKPPPAALAGVRAIYLRFFNRRLYQIEIFYEEKSEWKTLTDFTADLSANLKLPVAWQDIRGGSGIKCDGFTVFADKVLNPRVEITDVLTAEEFRQSQKKNKK